MMNMKKLAFAATMAMTALTSADALAYASNHACNAVLYDGLTQSGTKRLVLCASTGGVLYNFGPVNGKAELDVIIPTKKTLSYNNRYPSLELHNGAYTYEVSSDSIIVSNKTKTLATVKMREPRVSNLGWGLQEYGIPEAD